MDYVNGNEVNVFQGQLNVLPEYLLYFNNNGDGSSYSHEL